MKEYTVYFENDAESVAIQRKLLATGFTWAKNLRHIKVLPFPGWIHINDGGEPGVLRWSNKWYHECHSINVRGVVPISRYLDFRDLEGVPPEKQIEIDGKEYPESAIRAALEAFQKNSSHE